LETAAKLLKFLERVLAVFSKCALKLLDNQVDFDSAIPCPVTPPQPRGNVVNSLHKRFCARAGSWSIWEQAAFMLPTVLSKGRAAPSTPQGAVELPTFCLSSRSQQYAEQIVAELRPFYRNNRARDHFTPATKARRSG
jgi:hypothetical protein